MIFKNEASYLAEWIEYHELVGVDHFFLYDHGSIDHPLDILNPYIASGTTTYIYYPLNVAKATNVHLRAWDEGLKAFGPSTFWMAFMNSDEFIVPLSCPTVPKCLTKFEKAGTVLLHWILYGSDNQDRRTKGLVIERFRSHPVESDIHHRYTNAVVGPECSISMSFHFPTEMVVGCRIVNTRYETFERSSRHRWSHERIIVHHYCIKSREEFRAKRSRGYGHVHQLPAMSEVGRQEYNAIQNSSVMERYVPVIKNRLRARFQLPATDDSMWLPDRQFQT
jgi:hypothetical protein